MKKRTSKLLIFDPKHRLYCTYRAPGPWTNANTLSFVGADGDQVEGVVSEAAAKLSLVSQTSDWTMLKEVDNPTNNEVNLVWQLGPTVVEVVYRSRFYGGIMCISAVDIWVWKHMLSPAALTIAEALPDIFGAPRAAG